MFQPKISIIVGISKNNVIGKENTLPWHIPADLKRFKEVTSGHAIIMGRKTYESIGRLLPKRVNIIVTRDTAYHVEGAVIAHSLEEAIEKAKETEQEEVFIIGGGQIYQQAMSLADKLYLTVVDTIIEGDTVFPDYAMFAKKVFEQHGSDNGYDYTFLELEK